jgi:hypothetical protein
MEAVQRAPSRERNSEDAADLIEHSLMTRPSQGKKLERSDGRAACTMETTASRPAGEGGVDRDEEDGGRGRP